MSFPLTSAESPLASASRLGRNITKSLERLSDGTFALLRFTCRSSELLNGTTGTGPDWSAAGLVLAIFGGLLPIDLLQASAFDCVT